MLYSSSKIVPYEAESAQNKRFQSQATVEHLYTILIVTWFEWIRIWILFCIYIQTVQYEVWPHLMWCSHLCVHRLLKLLDLLLTNCSPYFWMSTVCSCAMVAGCGCPLMKPLTQRVPCPVRRHVGTRFFSKEVSPHPERLALLHCPHCTTILYSFRLDVPVPAWAAHLSFSQIYTKNNETREAPGTVLDI